MSAWLVSNKHIDLLVSAALAFKLVGRASATDVGKMLYEENVKSLNYRYGEDRIAESGESDAPAAYSYAQPSITEDPLDPGR